MELAKKITAILYLERDNFVYLDTVTGIAMQYQYPPEVISDLEIINEQTLLDNIAALIQENKVPPSQFVIIMGPSLIFEKKIPLSQDQTEQNEMIQKFVETVPFEEVSFTKYPMEDGIEVLAVNTYFFETFKHAFEKQRCMTSSVFPVYILQEDFSAGLNVDLGKRILAKIDSIKQYNLLQQQEIILPSGKKEQKVAGKKSNNRVYLLAGVFGFLILVLIIMVVLQK